MSGLIRLVDIPTHGDQRGSLSVAELGGALPFVVRRAYWLHGTQPGVSRGFHSHKKLNQLCVCVKGSVRFLLSDGKSRESVTLDRPDRGLLIGPNTWREMHDFSPDCVLLVLADAEYDEGDYVRIGEGINSKGIMNESVSFENFDRDTLRLTTVWLGDDDLRKQIDAGPLDLVKQEEWFNSLANRNDYKIWSVSFEGVKVGVVGLKKIAVHKAEYFGYIGSAANRGKGIGTEMIKFAERQARQLGVSVLELTVLDSNTRAIKLYVQSGYRPYIACDGRLKMLKII